MRTKTQHAEVVAGSPGEVPQTGAHHADSNPAGARAVAFNQVEAKAGRAQLLHTVSAQAAPGEVTVLVGPNGSGKSTLLRTLFNGVKYTGGVHLGVDDVRTMSATTRVRRLGILTQEQEPVVGTRTREAVELGRTARQGSFGRLSREDHGIVNAAMERVGVSELSERDLATLSGGERQRAHVARVLAQDTDVIVMDEPTNHLDIGHQLSTLKLLTELAHQEGCTVLVALHDLAQAAQWADRVIMLVGGQVVASGRPAEVLTGERIREYFGVDSTWVSIDGRRRLIIG